MTRRPWASSWALASAWGAPMTEMIVIGSGPFDAVTTISVPRGRLAPSAAEMPMTAPSATPSLNSRVGSGTVKPAVVRAATTSATGAPARPVGTVRMSGPLETVRATEPSLRTRSPSPGSAATIAPNGTLGSNSSVGSAVRPAAARACWATASSAPTMPWGTVVNAPGPEVWNHQAIPDSTATATRTPRTRRQAVRRCHAARSAGGTGGRVPGGSVSSPEPMRSAIVPPMPGESSSCGGGGGPPARWRQGTCRASVASGSTGWSLPAPAPVSSDPSGSAASVASVGSAPASGPTAVPGSEVMVPSVARGSTIVGATSARRSRVPGSRAAVVRRTRVRAAAASTGRSAGSRAARAPTSSSISGGSHVTASDGAGTVECTCW